MRAYQKGVILAVFLTFFFFVPGLAEKNSKKELKMTIPVRIFSNGLRIKNVSFADLIIQENNQVQTITSIKTIRKKMNSSPSHSRLFILLLKINDHNTQLKKTLNMIFKNILTEQDQLIILVNDRSIFFQNLSDKDESLIKVNQVFAEQSEKTRMNMVIDIKKMEAFISYLRKDTQRTTGNDQATQTGGKIHRHYYMKYFNSYLERYLKMIQDYNQQYLTPRLDKYHFIFNQIKQSNKKKWVIHIQQMAKLPVLSKKNRAIINKMIKDLSDRDMTEAWYDELDYAKKISKVMGNIDEALGVTSIFPTEEIINLIYKIDATLYSIFMEPAMATFGNNPGRKKVYAEIKTKWEKIAYSTGGKSIDPVYLEDNFQKIRAEEDIVFLVSFIRKIPQISRKIKIKPNKKNFILFYDPNPESEYITEYLNKKGIKALNIKIQNFQFKQKKLSLVITHFQMKKIKNQISGQIQIRISIKNEKNQIVFDQNKNFQTTKKKVKITINLNRLKTGYHKVTTEITDLISGDTRIETFSIKKD